VARLKIVIPADLAVIRAVTEGIVQLLRGKPGVIGHEVEIALALREALANAIRHGCRCDRTKFVECLVTYQSTGDLLMVVRDPGPGFDVGSVPSPLEATNLLKAGGRGIFLIRHLMDEVRFADGGREIRMRMRKRHRW
jgi:serine/threonine-protein kinase RsbW